MNGHELQILEERLALLIAGYRKIREERNNLSVQMEELTGKVGVLEAEINKFRLEREDVLKRVSSLIERIDNIEVEVPAQHQDEGKIS